MKRRNFLRTTALAAVSAASAADSKQLHIATNTYPWGTFAKREGKEFVQHTDELLAAIASTGITGYEPNIHQGFCLDTGDGLEAANALQNLWTGNWLANRAPQISPMTINGKPSTQSVELTPTFPSS